MLIPAVVVLIVAGFHVPVIALVELITNAGGAEFKHKGPIGEKTGFMFGAVISISMVVLAAHCPASGVKV